jgi:HK97 family phage prohead protease
MEPIKDLITLSTGQAGLRATLHCAPEPDPDEEDLLRIRASDASLDRDQEIIEPAGWRLDNYRKNPVIQNAHNYGDLLFTIGRAEVTELRDGALHQVWRFAAAANPVARIARDLYRGKFLNACSVGFIPGRWEYGDAKTPYRRRFLEQELLEVSAVAIPSNPNALVAGLKSGAVRRADLEEAMDLLKTISAALETKTERTANGSSGNDAAKTTLAQCHQLAQDLAAIWRR